MGTLQAALQLAEEEIAVFPCIPNGKEPLVPWRQAASTDPEVIARWFEKWPTANLAMPTGFTGGGRRSVEVLDIDIRDGGNGLEIAENLQRQGVIANAFVCVRTPSGGLHYWFRPEYQSGGSLRGQYVDFKANGGYVLVPPSVINGKSYGYIFRHKVTPEHKAIDWNAVREQYRKESLGTAPDGNYVQDIEVLAEKFLVKVQEGNRNNALFWAACRAFEAGIKNVTPLVVAAKSIGLEKDEIKQTLDSAARRHGIVLVSPRSANVP